MENLGYLKDVLQTNIPRVVTMAKRGASYPDKYKPGKLQYFYVFHRADGPDVKHYASEFEEETLRTFQPGESLQVVRQEKQGSDGTYKLNIWTPPEGAEARMAATPQLGNTRMAGDARKLEERQHNENEKWAKKDIAQTLGMLTKLYFDIPTGGVAIDRDACMTEAFAFAKKHRPAFIKAINDSYMEDVLGINQEPKFADEPVHKPSINPEDLPF